MKTEQNTPDVAGLVERRVMRYAKDFYPDTRVVENCKYMQSLGKIQELEAALKVAMTTLKQIAETPRNAGAKRNANATVKFLQTQGIDA